MHVLDPRTPPNSSRPRAHRRRRARVQSLLGTSGCQTGASNLGRRGGPAGANERRRHAMSLAASGYPRRAALRLADDPVTALVVSAGHAERDLPSQTTRAGRHERSLRASRRGRREGERRIGTAGGRDGAGAHRGQRNGATKVARPPRFTSWMHRGQFEGVEMIPVPSELVAEAPPDELSEPAFPEAVGVSSPPHCPQRPAWL